MTQEKENQQPQFNNPVQDMTYAVYKMYQDYWKQQQQATLQYWTEIIRTTYNPWK